MGVAGYKEPVFDILVGTRGWHWTLFRRWWVNHTIIGVWWVHKRL